jgi:ribosome-associated protein
MTKPDFNLLQTEVDFSTARSGGPGGQNVNKVNSKVILRFDVTGSRLLSEEQKLKILPYTSDGVISLQSQEDRSQLRNKDIVIKKFNVLLGKAFAVKKKRTATKPSKTSVQKRISGKKHRSEKKQWRQRPE